MAIGKWISFGTSQSATAPVPVVVEQRPIIPAADAKLFGLENFGNTCYANSVLQALYFCGPFRDLLIQHPDPSVPDIPPLPLLPPTPSPPPQPQTTSGRRKPTRTASISEPPSVHPDAPPAIPIPPSPPSLLSALRSLFLHISRNPADKGTVAPKAFIEKLKELNELFRGSQHQDAHEFLNFLLNKIMEEMEEDERKQHSSGNGIVKLGEDLSASIATLSTQPPSSTSTAHAAAHHATIVHRLFEGVLTSETRCLTCETVSARDESFLDLSIDIEQNSSVTACLRQFSASEMLCQKNKFFCDSCCDLQEAEKRMKIKKLPNVLALHLKRFKYQEDVQKYIKLAYRVAFPLELRLFNTVDDAENPDRLYELFAIVVHIGTGPHHGHYVTIIKARGVWTLFDDDTVSTIKESEISKYFGESNSGSAYVLYYQAVDLNLPALGLKAPTPPPASATTTDVGSSLGKPVSLTTGEPSDQGHAPGSPAPAVPPGLIEEPEHMDDGDPPSLSPASAKANHALPNLSLHIPTADSVTPAGPSSPQPHRKNLFRSLRTTPSGTLRENRKSGADAFAAHPAPPASPSSHRRPRTAPSEHDSHTDSIPSAAPSIPSVPSSPVPAKQAFPNGHGPTTPIKERAPEKKPSSWFKRKSSSRVDALPPLPQSPSTPRLGRRGSAAAVVHSPPASSGPPLASSSASEPLSPSSHKKSAPDLTGSHRRDGKRESGHGRRPSTANATLSSSERSSRPSSGVGMPPPLPPLPGSPSSGNGPGADQVLDIKGKKREGTGSASRPGSSTKTQSSREASPFRTAPSSAHGHGSAAPSESQHSHVAHPRPPPAMTPLAHAYTHSSSTHNPHGVPLQPFHSFGASAGGGIGDTPVVPPSASAGMKESSGSSAANNWRRATRKLSFTAPLLGLGRRDRDRKEAPPSSFAR